MMDYVIGKVVPRYREHIELDAMRGQCLAAPRDFQVVVGDMHGSQLAPAVAELVGNIFAQILANFYGFSMIFR